MLLFELQTYFQASGLGVIFLHAFTVQRPIGAAAPGFNSLIPVLRVPVPSLISTEW